VASGLSGLVNPADRRLVVEEGSIECSKRVGPQEAVVDDAIALCDDRGSVPRPRHHGRSGRRSTVNRASTDIAVRVEEPDDVALERDR
jgi:hypothetical protein